MRSLALTLVFMMIVSVVPTAAGEQPILVRVEVGDRAEALEVGSILNADEKPRQGFFYGWGTENEIEMVEKLGYQVEVVQPEPKNSKQLTMCSESFEPPYPWDCYPTWAQFEEMMAYYAATYSNIAELVNIGMSGQGDHELWAPKISDNPGTEENEPEILYTGTMHGDELVCYGTTVHLIDHILSSYNSDPQITRLVNETVLWINPLSNPDGTFYSGDHTVAGAWRELPASGLDPNRNFPDPSVPDDPSSPGWATEIQHMIDLAEAESFSLAANCHSGEEVFNFPWDCWYSETPDHQWWSDVGIAYAMSAQSAGPAEYFDCPLNATCIFPGVVKGTDWYKTEGNRQDFMNWYHGCREVTLELSNAKLLDASLLDDHFEYNRQALLDYFDAALTGIRGVVIDAVSGDPVSAEFWVLGHDTEFDRSYVTTDPDVGDYHRLIEAGTYDLEVSADGYESMTVSGVTVTTGPGVFATVQDFALTPLPRYTASGLVTDGLTSQPIPGASVSLVGTAVTPVSTGSSGAYTIPDLLEDTYTFRVEAPNYGVVQADLLVGPGSTAHDFVLTPLVTLAADDFETDDGGMTASTGWEWGSDSTAGAHSGTKVWGTALDDVYDNNIQWTLDSEAVAIPAGDGAELRFWQWYDIEDGGYDGGNIKVSVDGGPFVLVDDPVPAYNDSSINGLDEEDGYSGTDNWHEVVVDLSSYIGHSIVARWTFGSDVSETHQGWYLDDVSITAWGGGISADIFSDGFENGDTGAWSEVTP